MVGFERYPHIKELLNFYITQSGNVQINHIFEKGITNAEDAETFSHFIWSIVDRIHNDAEESHLILGRADNTDMLPDLSYEVTKYMRSVGFYNVWERISNEENNIE